MKAYPGAVDPQALLKTQFFFVMFVITLSHALIKTGCGGRGGSDSCIVVKRLNIAPAIALHLMAAFMIGVRGAAQSAAQG